MRGQLVGRRGPVCKVKTVDTVLEVSGKTCVDDVNLDLLPLGSWFSFDILGYEDITRICLIGYIQS
jgi:hypothetical protein